MIGMFWMEKYIMVTGLTLVVRALFKPKGKKDMWVSAMTAGAALISMNLGAGLLYPYSPEQYVYGIAEGVFVGSAMVLLWTLGGKIFQKKPSPEEQNYSPGEERISHYTRAFTELAKTFLSVPSTRTLAVVQIGDTIVSIPTQVKEITKQTNAEYISINYEPDIMSDEL